MYKILKKLDFTHEETIEFQSEIKRLKNILKLDALSLIKIEEIACENFNFSFSSIRMLLKELLLVIFKDFKRIEVGNKEVIQMAIPMPNILAPVINDLNPYKHVTSSEYLIIYLSGILFNSYIDNECLENMTNSKMCGLNQSRYSLYCDKNYLIPNGIISCMSYCDELHKTGELLEITYGVRHYNYGIINQYLSKDKKGCFHDFAKNIIIDHSNKNNKNIESIFKKYNDKRLEISFLLDYINKIVAREKDAYVTFNEISLLNIFNLIYCEDMYEKAKFILNTFIKELKEKINKNEYIVRNPIRLGCIHLPFTDSSGDRIFIKNDAAVLVSSMYELDTINYTYLNEYERCIIPYIEKGYFGNFKEIANLIDNTIEEYSLDGFLFGQFEGDRALANFQPYIIENLKNKEKAYYLQIRNWHNVDSGYFNMIESIVSVIKQRKEGK